MASVIPFLQSVKLPVMQEVAQALICTRKDDEADITLRMANSAIFGLSELDRQKLQSGVPDAQSFSDISMLQA